MNTSHILITGASRGIGKALAEIYAAPNVHLSLFASQVENLTETQKTCELLGATVNCFGIPLSQADALMDEVKNINQLRPVDMVIANAGITGSTPSNRSVEDWSQIDRVLDINLKGNIASIHPLIPAMQKRQSGTIVLISSLAAFYGMTVTPAYSASKAGLKAYGEALQGLLTKDNVQVSMVFPGFVKSDMSDSFPGERPWMLSPQQAAKKIRNGIIKKRTVITFPLLLSTGTKLLNLLPNKVTNYIVNQLCYPI